VSKGQAFYVGLVSGAYVTIVILQVAKGLIAISLFAGLIAALPHG
jgi:hypothetical protein